MNKIKNLIISAIGADHPGIVAKLSGVINNHGGNIEESHMTTLGTDFVVIILISLDPEWEEALLVSLQSIQELSVITKETQSKSLIKGENCNIELSGADNEGIVNVLANYFSEKSMNILEMNTYVSNAPVTGTPLFNLNAIVNKTKEFNFLEIKTDLKTMGKKLGVEINIFE